MRLTFLRASLPLTKTIAWSPRDEQFTTRPYPLVSHVTSESCEVTDIDSFATSLAVAGAKGWCLLKGSLDAPLVDESRAGHSLEIPHEWVVFDFDGVDCEPSFEGAEQAISKYLPRACHDVDAVIQLSSSAARADARKLSCHIFMQLEEPRTTHELTDWLTAVNFTQPLKDELRLTDSGMALHYALDRSVASPAKLIYIAPPRCVGFTPRITEHVQVLTGRRHKVTLDKISPPSSDDQRAMLNALRAAAGMPEREWKTRFADGREILASADPCVVHDIKPSGSGFIRFNMNGGDSLAYFINVREPGLIGNFKGEPYLSTAQVAPDLFKALTKAAHALPVKLPPAEIEPLAFYATNRESTIYIGHYDREHDELRVDASNIGAAQSWLASFGVPRTANLPHYDLTCDMTSDIRFEDGYPIINTYRATDYIKQFADAERGLPCNKGALGLTAEAAPTVMRIMRWALGANDNATLYFFNWLAAVFQRRDRTMTAWVLHGRQGTGKGLLLHHVLRPLFGDGQVVQTLFHILGTSFNGYMRGKLIVAFNETDMSRSTDWSTTRSKLYDWITEPTITIHEKGKDAVEERNYANLIFCSNSPRPVQIEDGDRRFNVGEFQSERLFITPNEYAALAEHRELDALAKALGRWQIDEQMLLKPYSTDAKARIYEATHSLVDAIAKAIHEGDVRFFVDNRPDAIQLRTDFNGRVLPMREYDELLVAMRDDTLNVLHPNDLYVLFRIVTGLDRSFPEGKAQQRRVYDRYGLLSTTVVKSKRTHKAVRGLPAPQWRCSKEVAAEITELLQAKTDNVVNLRSAT